MNPRSTYSLLTVGLVACLAVASFAQGPVLTPLRLLPGDAALGAAAGDQGSPVIAAGGSGYLSAWVDLRSELAPSVTTPAPTFAAGSGRDVYAMRLDASGKPIQALPLVLSQGAADQTTPRVVWNGSMWLVSWLSQISTPHGWAIEVQAVRVSAAGQVLDNPPIQVLTYRYSTLAGLAVATDGKDWLVTTSGSHAGESALYGVRVTAQGSIVNPGGTMLHTTGGLMIPDVAWAGNNYLLVWPYFGVIYGRRFDATLKALDAAPWIIENTSTSKERIRIGSNGSTFLVTWQDRASQFRQIRGRRVSAVGKVLDANPIDMSNRLLYVVLTLTNVTWDGSQWFVVWEHTSAIAYARVDGTGKNLDPGGRRLTAATPRGEPWTAPAASGGIRLVWTDARNGLKVFNDIYGGSISATGVLGAEHLISTGAPAELQADVATDGNHYLVVFRRRVPAEDRILMHRLDATGRALWSEPRELARGPSLMDPQVAWNGSLYLVTWNDTRVRGARVRADGSVIDGTPLVLMPGRGTDVAALGSTFLVVGTDTPVYIEWRHPMAVRVRGSDGQVLDPKPLNLGLPYARNPAVTAVGNRWLVAWQRQSTHNNLRAIIQAAFVNAAGGASAEFRVGPSFYSYNPALASSGNVALLVWDDNRNGAQNRDVFAARIKADGTVLDPNGIPVTTAANTQADASVAWDGKTFFLSWIDERKNTFIIDHRADIYAARVDVAGKVLDPAGIAVTTGVGSEVQPAVAASGGAALLAGSVFNPAAPHTAFRIGTRTTGALPDPWTDLGKGLPGKTHTPTLTGSGDLGPGTTATLTVSGAPPGAFGVLGIGLTRVDLPLLGGTLVPSPDHLLFFQADASGGFVLPVAWPTTVPRRIVFYLQAWISDPGGPQGWTATNALMARTP